MKSRYSVLVPIIVIIMMAAVFVAQAEDAKPLLVEEGTPLQASPSSITTPSETSALGYKITTSKNDPLCDTGFGGYLDLEELDIYVTARVPSGDNFAIGPFFTANGPIEFYGQQYQGVRITDDGFILFGDSYSRPWEPQIIPQTNAPNGLAAFLWQDMEIVHDKARNHGVSLGTSTDGNIMVVEFDDIRLVSAPDSRFDVEMVMRRNVSNAPGAYEIVFAYDNLSGTLAGPLTIGVENSTGDNGMALVNKGSANQVISNGFMVCFDAVTGTPPASTHSSVEASDGIYRDKVKVTWGDASKAARYDIYRADVNGNSEIKLGTADDNLFNDISAAAGIPCTYRVKACNQYGCSSPSAHDTGWRAADDPPPYDAFYFMPIIQNK
jgi:hypothetical protein